MADRRIRIAVVFGGRSGEHDVSCMSAASMVSHLDPERYDVVPVRISSAGEWRVGRLDPQVDKIDAAALVEMTGGPGSADGGPAPASAQLGSIVDAITAFRDVDLVFPAIHGPYGEDGTIQSLLELADVPFVGNGVRASSASMDKEFTKKLLAASGIAVADSVTLRPGAYLVSAADRERLGLPVFVKPARAGSSLGVSRVDSWDDLDAAIEAARATDPKLLVEEAVHGREIDLGVLEYPDGRLAAGPPLEITFSGGRTFFDYDAKYTDSATSFEIPAKLDPEKTAELQDLAIRAFTALDCAGLLRVDFFLRDGVTPVLNEVNTFPGFTAVSQYPQMWAAAGLPYPALLDILIDTALTRSPEPNRR